MSSLPKNESPIYEITLPLTKQKLNFMPFRVLEKKLLMMALEADDTNYLLTNLKQILQNCCLSDVIIDKLPIIDIEYYFINLSGRSMGEIINQKYKCNNLLINKETKEESICGNIMDVDVNLLDIKVDASNYNDIIKLSSKMGIKFKYPDFKFFNKLTDIKSISELDFEVIYNCIDYIYDDDNVYHSHEIQKQELINFIDTLHLEQFAKIEEFFNNLPTLKEVVNVKCSKCGFEHKIEVEGLESFFG